MNDPTTTQYRNPHELPDLTDEDRELLRASMGTTKTLDAMHACGMPETFGVSELARARRNGEIAATRVRDCWRYSYAAVDHFIDRWFKGEVAS